MFGDSRTDVRDPIVSHNDPSEEERIRNDEQTQLDARDEERPPSEYANAQEGERPTDAGDGRHYEQPTAGERDNGRAEDPSEEERLANDEQNEVRDEAREDVREERPPSDAEEEHVHEEMLFKRTYDEIDGGFAEASDEGRTYEEIDGGYAQGGERANERIYEDVESGFDMPKEETGYNVPNNEESRVYNGNNFEVISNGLPSQSIVKQDIIPEIARNYEPAPKSSKAAWIAHGLLATLTFGLLLPASISSALFRDYLPSHWIYVHVYINVLSLLVTLITVIVAFVAMSSLGERNEGHLKEMHHIAGLALLLLISFQTANGFIRPPREFVTDDIDDCTPGAIHSSRDPRFTPRAIWQLMHRCVGLAIFLGGTWQVRSGLAIYARKFSTMDYGSVYLGYVGWLVFLLVAAKLYLPERERRKQGELKGLESMDSLGPTRLSDENSENASVGSNDLEGRPDDASEDFMQSELSNISSGFDQAELQKELEDCLKKADIAAKDLAGAERSGGSTLEMMFGTKYEDKADVKKFEGGNFADNYYSSESDGESDYVFRAQKTVNLPSRKNWV